LNPFKYTSGRWLRHENEQQLARYVDFDFNARCRKAIEACPGGSHVFDYENKEGGFNRVFIFHMDNDAKVIARRLSGSPTLTRHAEVATIAYGEPYYVSIRMIHLLGSSFFDLLASTGGARLERRRRKWHRYAIYHHVLICHFVFIPHPSIKVEGWPQAARHMSS
jgi:hypothetical protein